MSEILAYGLSVVTAPAAEIMTAAQAKLWARVDTTADDDIFTALIVAVRQQIEAHCNVTLINTTYDLKLDAWPAYGPVYLPRGPLSSVTSITYVASDGTSTVWASTNYVVDTSHPSGRIGLADGVSWPTLQNRISPITIRYVAGYGATSASVHDAILIAARILLTDLYENRQVEITGTIVSEHKAVANLLRLYENKNICLGAY